MTPTQRQGDGFFEYIPGRLVGLGRVWRIFTGVDTPEFTPVETGRGEEAAVEVLSWGEALDSGLRAGSFLFCCPGGSSLRLGCGYEIQSMSSADALALKPSLPRSKIIALCRQDLLTR